MTPLSQAKNVRRAIQNKNKSDGISATSAHAHLFYNHSNIICRKKNII